MKKEFVYLFGLICFLLCSCGKRQPLKDFTFLYTIEVFDNYKISFSFDSKKQFRKEIANYYMDNMENKQRPEIEEGQLTDEEFDRLRKLVEEADLPSMKEAYGFEKRPQETQDMLIQMILTQKENKKYISIQYDKELKLPASFVRLITELNRFSRQTTQ